MSRELLQQALAYDPDSGVFTWTSAAWHKRNRGAIAGSKKQNGYIEIQFQGKMLKAHRIAWLLCYGELAPDAQIDHIDGDRSNNRLINLRLVNHSTNQQNKHWARTDSATGLLGVSKNGRGWRAEILVEGKKMNLGTYATPALAHQAYVTAKRVYHEGCTI